MRAAVVIGGTSLLGGRGSYLGTIIGSLALVEINTLLIGLGLQPSMVQAALGAIIIALVSLYGRSAFTVFPSLAEGWGLPIGESLWTIGPAKNRRTSMMAEV